MPNNTPIFTVGVPDLCSKEAATITTDDFCREIAYKQMNTDYTATRMIGYLSHSSDLPDVEVVDEMLAILSDRNELIKKKESEQAQARISEIYRFGLDIK